jgi:hypothetical protein
MAAITTFPPTSAGRRWMLLPARITLRRLLCIALLSLAAGCSADVEPEATSADTDAPSAPARTSAAGPSTRAAPASATATPAASKAERSPAAATGSPAFERACTSHVLLPLLRKKFDDPASGAVIARVRIERCRAGYAHVYAIPENAAGRPPFETEQLFLQYRGGSWHSVSEGTGIACSDTGISRALLRACSALGYRTTSQLPRITDPQVAANRLIDAWMRHDPAAAGRLTRDEPPIDLLFSEAAPSTAPKAVPCRPTARGIFVCSYILAPNAELSIVVEGGASAGYEITGLEFGD